MTQNVSFSDNSIKKTLVSAFLFIFTFAVCYLLLVAVFRATGQWPLAGSLAAAASVVAYYVKSKSNKDYGRNLERYNKMLDMFKDFSGFTIEEFDLLYCGYHIVYYGNVKAKIRHVDGIWDIHWEDKLRNLSKHETVNTRLNGMTQLEVVSDYFKSRFRELHFSFDWDNLTLN